MVFRNVHGFKLHLTGIETFVNHIGRYPWRVQIAPYWNWNRDTYTTRIPLRGFKLHLTGIETSSGLPYSAVVWVQIAPYWNWNRSVSGLGAGTTSVQIAPYWNWNWDIRLHSRAGKAFKLHLTGIETVMRVITDPLNNCSNCTLLELKLDRWAQAAKQAKFKLHLTGIETTTNYLTA